MILKESRLGQAARVTYYRTGVRLAQGNVPVDRVAASRVLHVSGITAGLSARDAMHAAVRAARTAGVPVSVAIDYHDQLWPDLREAEEILSVLACSADVLFVRQSELDLVKPALAGDREVIVMRGTRGRASGSTASVMTPPESPHPWSIPTARGTPSSRAISARRWKDCTRPTGCGVDSCSPPSPLRAQRLAGSPDQGRVAPAGTRRLTSYLDRRGALTRARASPNEPEPFTRSLFGRSPPPLSDH